MYIAISPQKMGSTYTSSVGTYVDYLEKEDLGKHPDLKENFFDQLNDKDFLFSRFYRLTLNIFLDRFSSFLF